MIGDGGEEVRSKNQGVRIKEQAFREEVVSICT
jgi:hypothetical protein